MNLINLSLIACSLLLSCASCHRKLAKEKETTNAVTLQGTPSDTMTQATGPSNDNEQTGSDNGNSMNSDSTNSNRMGNGNYDLVLSFYSIGAGIDNEAKESYDKFLDSYRDKVSVEETRWGREGEVDYCLKLSGLSEGEKNDFVEKSRNLLEKSKLVHINENAPCVHKK